MKFSREINHAILRLIIIDYFAAVIGWILFWLYRQFLLHDAIPEFEPGIRMWVLRDYIIGLILIPLFWLILHFLSGAYFDPYRKSRLQEWYRTVIVTIIGCLCVGFTAIANDYDTFVYFFKITSLYFIVQLAISITLRTIFLNALKRRLRNHHYGYNTIIIGGNGKSEMAYNEIKNSPSEEMYRILGLVSVNNATPINSNLPIPLLGHLDNLEQIIKKHKIEEVIIALESTEHQKLEEILLRLSYMKLYIRVLPDVYDIISGNVKTNNVLDPIFLTIQPELLPDWQKVIKRVIDVFGALFALIFLSPLYLICAIMVRRSSKGPIIYRQVRIGLFGKPFYINKFRSMCQNAELNGPALSSENDMRITKWGKVMRKWRLDELPQFVNILKGDMSLVGPRPERQYFINQIVKTHPHYKYLHRVKPGLTSWGMVNYGYAENIDEMIERMKYDLLYIENCNILLDLKILIYTFKVLAQGRGK